MIFRQRFTSIWLFLLHQLVYNPFSCLSQSSVSTAVSSLRRYRRCSSHLARHSIHTRLSTALSVDHAPLPAVASTRCHLVGPIRACASSRAICVKMSISKRHVHKSAGRPQNERVNLPSNWIGSNTFGFVGHFRAVSYMAARSVAMLSRSPMPDAVVCIDNTRDCADCAR